MARRTVKTTGFRELSQQLDQFKKSTGKGVMRRAARRGLQAFDEAWRKDAPVQADGPDRTQPHMRDTGGIGGKPKRVRRRREWTVEAFAGPGPNPQAIQQEFGNRNHPAQPFVRPAWEETHEQVLEDVKAELAGEIEKTAQRLAKRAKRKG